MTKFQLKTKIEFGLDSLSVLNEIKNQKVFIVTDPFMVKSGTINNITKHLLGNECQLFTDIVPDPPIELVVNGVSEVIKFKPDVVIALGGGSAIDAAKSIMDFAKSIGNLNDIAFVAIPTTSGTGSEVTSFAVITDKEKGTKYPLVSDSLLPDMAILDPILVKTVPSPIVADTGMDVLTHALEAYVSTKANDFSDALAEKAICLVMEYLLPSYESSENNIAREKMHYASCLAGMAFNITSLGVNHAIAHVIGGKLHIPHGRTNSILLPHVIEYNAAIEGYNPANYTLAARKYAHVSKLLGLSGNTIRISVKNLINEVIKLQRLMKMPTKLTECKLETEITNSLRTEIAKLALEDGCIVTNPREVSMQDVNQILHKIS